MSAPLSSPVLAVLRAIDLGAVVKPDTAYSGMIADGLIEVVDDASGPHLAMTAKGRDLLAVENERVRRFYNRWMRGTTD